MKSLGIKNYRCGTGEAHTPTPAPAAHSRSSSSSRATTTTASSTNTSKCSSSDAGRDGNIAAAAVGGGVGGVGGAAQRAVAVNGVACFSACELPQLAQLIGIRTSGRIKQQISNHACNTADDLCSINP